tara:strand:- start:2525 stop:2785 length:261 start_codon:yes stop_codon:yes gene_type:complete
MISFKTFGLGLMIEAFVVGITLVLVGTIISGIFSFATKSDLPPVCKDWNKNYIMELSLFFTGFATHLLLEVVGLNKWYCKNGVACK